MKARTWIGWVVTGLMAALMLLSAAPDVLRIPGAVAVFRHLGYPRYLLPFLGTAKGLAIVGVLIPRFTRLKEWVYAGLSIDVGGALYSHLSVGDPASVWMPAAVGLALMTGSYIAYQTRTSQTDSQARRVPVEGAAAGAPIGLRA